MLGAPVKCVTNVLQVSEYLVVCFTSSLTFSIAGVAKEIMTLSLAVYIYNEHLSYVNLVSPAHHYKDIDPLPYAWSLEEFGTLEAVQQLKYVGRIPRQEVRHPNPNR